MNDNSAFVDEAETVKSRNGIVTNCTSLAVRIAPDRTSDIVQIIKCGDEVTVDDDTGNAEFYKVCTVFGVSGYCVKEFIELI